MCDPVTALVVGGSVLSAGSAISQGRAARNTSVFNARLAENEATRTRNKAVEQENEQRRRTAELISRQRTQLAANNLDLNSGSALQLQEDAALIGEVDALRIRNNFNDQASALDQEASLSISSGRAKQQSANLSAVGSLLTSAGAVASKWYTPQSSLNSATIDSGSSFSNVG